MKDTTDAPPITAEAGNGFDPIEWTGKSKNPHKINVRPAVLQDRQRFAVNFAQTNGGLWNPADKTSFSQSPFAIGMECGQYSFNLLEMLTFAKRIGCQIVQPSGSQIDLAMAAINSQYRLQVWNIFAKAKMALTTVSIHVDAYAAIAILGNKKAGMFTPGEIAGKIQSVEQHSKDHL